MKRFLLITERCCGVFHPRAVCGDFQPEPLAATFNSEPLAALLKPEPLLGSLKPESLAGSLKPEPLAGSLKPEPFAALRHREGDDALPHLALCKVRRLYLYLDLRCKTLSMTDSRFLRSYGNGISLGRLFGAMLATYMMAPALHSAETTFFPFGVYDKSERTPGTAAWETHYVNLIKLLRSNNINTLLTLPYRDVRHSLYVMDRADADGLRVIMGTGNPLNAQWDMTGPNQPFDRAYRHRSVIAIKSGDEPDTIEEVDTLARYYAAFRAFYSHPVITAMVGDGMDGTDRDFARKAWATLRADVLFVRHYPIRRRFDLVNWSRDKTALPLEDWSAVMERYAEKQPWWFIMQTFGRGVAKSEASYWRLPSADEIEAMAHIALANGARGIIAFCLQNFDIEKAALVDAELRPMAAHDGSFPLDAMRQMGELVQQHAAFLLRHTRGTFSVRSNQNEVVVVPRIDPADGSHLIYAINKNTTRDRETIINFAFTSVVAHAVDVFTGRSVPVTLGAAEGRFETTLAPGQGQLWRLVPAKLPPVPANVRAVPGENGPP